MSNWKEGSEISDLKGKRILYSKIFGISLSHFTIEKCQLGMSEKNILKSAYDEYIKWKNSCSLEVLYTVLNGVPEDKVFDNMQNTIGSQVSQYLDAMKKDGIVEEQNNEKIEQKIFLSGKIWRNPNGIMIDNKILNNHKNSMNKTLRFLDKQTGKIFETSFKNYFSNKVISSENIKYANNNMKFLSLTFFKEINMEHKND